MTFSYDSNGIWTPEAVANYVPDWGLDHFGVPLADNALACAREPHIDPETMITTGTPGSTFPLKAGFNVRDVLHQQLDTMLGHRASKYPVGNVLGGQCAGESMMASASFQHLSIVKVQSGNPAKMEFHYLLILIASIVWAACSADPPVWISRVCQVFGSRQTASQPSHPVFLSSVLKSIQPPKS
eukprot:COSAG02_NODE_2298_length_9193_cov_83.003189_4_plen_184_part_00